MQIVETSFLRAFNAHINQVKYITKKKKIDRIQGTSDLYPDSELRYYEFLNITNINVLTLKTKRDTH